MDRVLSELDRDEQLLRYAQESVNRDIGQLLGAVDSEAQLPHDAQESVNRDLDWLYGVDTDGRRAVGTS
jgi:hypothetical protein